MLAFDPTTNMTMRVQTLNEQWANAINKQLNTQSKT